MAPAARRHQTDALGAATPLADKAVARTVWSLRLPEVQNPTFYSVTLLPFQSRQL